jgi:putative FmdB family regulatory protein
MPFYEYECSNCKFYVEALQKITDEPLKQCPSCKKQTLKKLVSAPNFRLKGGGWYETDFKSEKEERRNLAEREEAAEAKSEAKEPEAKEAKPEAKPAEAEKAAKKSVAIKAPAKPVKAAAKPAAKTKSAAKKPATKAAAKKKKKSGRR